jgi:hypothetical protein
MTVVRVQQDLLPLLSGFEKAGSGSEGRRRMVLARNHPNNQSLAEAFKNGPETTRSKPQGSVREGYVFIVCSVHQHGSEGLQDVFSLIRSRCAVRILLEETS